jgi:hypothetical protein
MAVPFLLLRNLGAGSEALGVGSEALGVGSEGLGVGSEGLGVGSEGLGVGSESLGDASLMERKVGENQLGHSPSCVFPALFFASKLLIL